MIGGPPCQGFSLLNRDGVGLERRALWREYLRALRESGAEAFVMENVPELLRLRRVRGVQGPPPRTSSASRVEGRILNAADYGVPQRRRRAIVIGVRHGRDPVAGADALRPGRRSRSGGTPWRTFADAVEGLPLKPTGEDWHIGRNPRPETIIRYRHVPHDGGNRFQMQDALDAAGLGHLVPACWRNKPTGTTDVFGRLCWNRPGVHDPHRVLQAGEGPLPAPERGRPITIREAARCMSFPDDFVLPSDQPMTAIAKQIGNAVPPLLAVGNCRPSSRRPWTRRATDAACVA